MGFCDQVEGTTDSLKVSKIFSKNLAIHISLEHTDGKYTSPFSERLYETSGEALNMVSNRSWFRNPI